MQMRTAICLLFMLLGCLRGFAQERTIHGTVKDTQGRPLPNVVVSDIPLTKTTTLVKGRPCVSLTVP